MNKDIKIGNDIFKFDKEATEKFYSTQNNIIDDCNCTDCHFYFDIVANYSFEIFKILRDLGVDLRKNLSSEPTGVWCVRNESGQLIHGNQVYKFIGQLLSNRDIEYSRNEDNFKINVTFHQATVDSIYVSLVIGVS